MNQMTTALAKAGVRKSKSVRVGASTKTDIKPAKPRAPRVSKLDAQINDFIRRYS